MANAEHLELLRQDVEMWNAWRAEKPSILPDLDEASLCRANLSRANLSHANLSWATVPEIMVPFQPIIE